MLSVLYLQIGAHWRFQAARSKTLGCQTKIVLCLSSLCDAGRMMRVETRWGAQADSKLRLETSGKRLQYLFSTCLRIIVVNSIALLRRCSYIYITSLNFSRLSPLPQAPPWGKGERQLKFRLIYNKIEPNIEHTD